MLDEFTRLFGETVSRDTFHLASFQEGRRIGQQEATLEDGLRRTDAILGQETRVLQVSPRVELFVASSALLDSGHAVQRGVVLGFLEGLLRARGKRVQGLVQADGDGFWVRFIDLDGTEPAH